MSTPIVKTLKKAMKLIESPDAWCQGSSAANEKGRSVAINDPEAVRLCAYAALAKVCFKADDPPDGDKHDHHHETLLVVHEAIVAEIGRPPVVEGRAKCDDVSLIQYNDRHTHEDVLNIFKQAISIAESSKGK